MLKSLVRKFKSHSLNDDGQQIDHHASDQQPHRRSIESSRHHHHLRNSTTAQQHVLRAQCCEHKKAVCPHHHQQQQQRTRPPRNQQGSMAKSKEESTMGDWYDSGTESDEELEYIETNSTHSVPVSQTSDYYASQQSLSVNSCRSSHCGSPLLALSDQECYSWESIGSESGINLRASSTMTRQHHHQHHHRVHHPNSSVSTGLPPNFNYEFLLANPSSMIGSNPRGSTTRESFSTTTSTTTPTMFTEELPNHHYHTRQQFQRLKQQISMKNGNQDGEAEEEASSIVSGETAGNLNSNTTVEVDRGFGNSTHITAFTPIARHAIIGGQNSVSFTTTCSSVSGRSVDGSSFDELEEIGTDSAGRTIIMTDPQPPSSLLLSQRRCRSSTLSTMSSSGVSVWSSSSSASSASSTNRQPSLGAIEQLSGRGGSWSEKRKWSQTRLQQQNHKRPSIDCCCYCSECGLTESQRQNQQQRTVLHAARKTPVKLLYPLTNRGISGASTMTVEQKMDSTIHRQPTDGGIRKTRFSTRKKCRGDDETRSMDEGDQSERNLMIKRPSLDFDKMRAKRVGASSDAGKSRRSNSFNGLTKSRRKDHHHHNGYQLRSNRRQHCLFRPLDPQTPTDAMNPASDASSSNDGNLFSVHHHHNNHPTVRFE